MLRMSPEIVEPDFLIFVETITAMKGGTAAGGFELLPGRLVQVPPQVVAGRARSAKPLNDAGAPPPVRSFSFHHSAPHHSTVAPRGASWTVRSPRTKPLFTP